MSSTSSSCVILTSLSGTDSSAAAFALASLSERAATHFSLEAEEADVADDDDVVLTRYAGMRWPHQSCRDTHQSLELSAKSAPSLI